MTTTLATSFHSDYSSTPPLCDLAYGGSGTERYEKARLDSYYLSIRHYGILQRKL